MRSASTLREFRACKIRVRTLGTSAYDCRSSYCPRPPHGQSCRPVPALRQPQRARRGTRKKKLEIVQLWRCAACKRTFTPGPAALHNRTYPLRMILASAHRLQPGLLARRDGRASQEENQPRRLAQHNHQLVAGVSAALHLRPTPRRRPCALPRRANDPLGQTLSPPDLRLRLPPCEAGASAPRRNSTTSARAVWARPRALPRLQISSRRIPTTCPHDLFRRDDDPKARASQAQPEFADVSAHHREPKGECGDRHSGAHHSGRRQQQITSRDAAALHARQRQRDRRDRDPHLAHGERHRRPGAPARHRAGAPHDGDSRARSPATSTSCRSATAQCTSSTTSRTRAPTSRSRSLPSTHSR